MGVRLSRAAHLACTCTQPACSFCLQPAHTWSLAALRLCCPRRDHTCTHLPYYSPHLNTPQVAAILAERMAAAAAAQAAAAAEAARREERERAKRGQREREKPSIRSTAWETKVAERAEVGFGRLGGWAQVGQEGHMKGM